MEAFQTRETIDDISRFLVRETSIPLPEITFERLVSMYGTGRSVTISGSGRDRKTCYRAGHMTAIGDIEESAWTSLVEALIEREGEQELFKSLLAYVTDSCRWLHSTKERHEYALQLHCRRLFDNPQWAGYTEFNGKYRKENAK